MIPDWPRAWGSPPATGLIRSRPEDFQVSEQLGFDLSGEGEHVFLYLQKRQLNSMELLERVARLSGIAARDIGISGLKDRHAVTRQWVSIGMAGKDEPDWQLLEAAGDVQLLEQGRHRRKLRRGVHKANRFRLVLRQLRGDQAALAQRLERVRDQGVPNYFGEQRFGRNGATLAQARQWLAAGGRRVARNRRSLYLSALRSYLFNTLLAARVAAGEWNTVAAGDVCMLHGSRSLFHCDAVDARILERVERGDIQPGLPLWGRGNAAAEPYRAALAQYSDICDFLERAGLELAWRPARLLADDFCWQFCDDDSLQLDFALGAGGYATALLAELVQYNEKQPAVTRSGSGGE